MSQSDHLMNMLEDMISAAKALGMAEQVANGFPIGSKPRADWMARRSRLERGIIDHKRMIEDEFNSRFDRGYQAGRYNFPEVTR